MAAQFDLAELERLYAAHEALSIVKDTETRYKARNKLRIFLHKHVPAILAMGAECERLALENAELATALDNANGVIRKFGQWLDGWTITPTCNRRPSEVYGAWDRVREGWAEKLDPAAILAAHDKALTGPLEARIVELERDVWSDPELLAHFFHDEYEKLAPAYGYETRKASAVAWADVPEKNKALMVAVCESAIKQRRDAAREAVSAWRPANWYLYAMPTV